MRKSKEERSCFPEVEVSIAGRKECRRRMKLTTTEYNTLSHAREATCLLRQASSIKKSKMATEIVETTAEQVRRLIGFDIISCPCCRKGEFIPACVIPGSRSIYLS